MTKDVLLLGVPLLLTIAYIIYRIIVNIKEDGVFDFGPIHIATRKYKLTSNGYKKVAKKKIKRIPLIAFLLVNGAYILIVSFFIFGASKQVPQALHYVTKSLEPVAAPLKAANKITFDQILDEGMKVIGFLSALGGMILTFREIFERKNSKAKG